jgi:hypothetical protein
MTQSSKGPKQRMTAAAHPARHEQIFAEQLPVPWGNFAEHSIDRPVATIFGRGPPVPRALRHGGFTLGRFSPKITPQMQGQLPPRAKGLM